MITKVTSIVFEQFKLDVEKYDFNNFLKTNQFQQNIKSFMNVVRKTKNDISIEIDKINQNLIKRFCKFVDDKKI